MKKIDFLRMNKIKQENFLEVNRTLRILCLCCLFLVTPFSSNAQVSVEPVGKNDDGSIPAMVAISPSRVELKLGNNNRVDGNLRLVNLSDQDMVIHAEINNFDLDTNNQIRLIEPTEFSLDQWLIVSPLKFTIPAKKSQTIRLSARAPFKPSPGEYKALIGFEQQLPEGGSNEQTSIRVNFRLNAGIYVLSDPVQRKGEIQSIKAVQNEQGEEAIAITVKSTGNANVRLNGQMSVWSQGAFPGKNNVELYILSGDFINTPDNISHLSILPTSPVFAGTTRTLLTSVPPKTDSKPRVVFIKGRLGDTDFEKMITLP